MEERFRIAESRRISNGKTETLGSLLTTVARCLSVSAAGAESLILDHPANVLFNKAPLPNKKQQLPGPKGGFSHLTKRFVL